MTNDEIQRKLDELGIVNIEANGVLTAEVVEDAIRTTESLLDFIDVDAISKDIETKENEYRKTCK